MGSRAQKLCKFSGDLSYPLYMTHYAVIWSFGEYYSRHKPSAAYLALIVVAGTIVLAGFAYLVMVLDDKPMRHYLRPKLRANS